MNARAASVALLCAALLCTPAAEAQPRPAPTVKLLSAGKGPRRPLRYLFQTGATEVAVMRMSMDMKNRLPGGDVDIVIPMVETDLTVNLGEKRGADEYLYMFAIDELRVKSRPGVAPGVEGAMSGLLDKMKGMNGSAYISTRGVTRESSFLLPAGLAPELRQMLEQTEDNLDQMSAPLPVEAIGKGARWQTRTESEQGGIKTRQTLTYEVVAIKGDRVDLKVTIAQTAAPQMVSTAAGTFELVSYKGAGRGKVTIDLRHAVPESSVEMAVDQVMLVDLGGGSKQKVPTRVEVEMTIGHKN